MPSSVPSTPDESQPGSTPRGRHRERMRVAIECVHAAEAAGQIARLLLPEAVERAIQADIEECAASGSPITARCAYRSSGGQDVVLAYSITVTPAAERQGAWLRVVIEEIPAASDAEQPFVQHLLADALDASGVLAYVKDAYGRYCYANRALAALYDLPLDDILGRTDEELWDPAVARLLWETEQRLLESEAPLWVKESLPGGGQRRAYLSNKFVLHDRDGQAWAIASLSTDVTDHALADTSLSRSAERIMALNECFLSFGPDPEENMRRLVELSYGLLGADCATYLRAGRGLISSLGLWCASPSTAEGAGGGSLCAELLAQSDQDVHVLRRLQHSSFARTDPNVQQYGLETCIGRIVRLGGRALGVLSVFFKADHEPSEEDGRLLGIVASALAVEERRLRAEQRQAVAYGIAEAASRAEGLRDLGCYIHQELRRLIEANNFYLAIDDRENRQIVFPYYVDETYPDGGLKRPPRPYASGLTEYVIRGGQALLLHEDEIRSRVREGSLQIIGAVPRVWLGVPLTEAGETIGMMAVQSYACAEAYDREDLEFLEFVSGQVTGAIKARRSSDALAESESRYRLLAENVSDIIWARDSALRLAYVSASVERVLGYTVQEAMAQSLEEAFTPDSARALRELVEQVATQPSGGRDDATLEVECYRKDGATVWAEVTMTFLCNGDGRLTRILGVTRDITQRRELERQLRQVNKLESLGQLAGGIAHHFNNLLTVINGYSQFMLTSLEDGDPVRRDAESILKAGRRAAELTRQLLDFSRRRVMNVDVVNLNILLIKTADMLRSVIGDDIDLRLDLAEGLPNVRVDPGQIEQVVLNLAVNSRDAMPDGGTLTLGTRLVGAQDLPSGEKRREAQYVRLTVGDSGKGMPPEVREHLFEPFFTTKEVGQGTGLGLATAYGIVTQAGGEIGVDTALGRGTRVHVYLAAVEQQAPPSPEAAPAPTDAVPGGKELILVLEDEPDVRDLTVRMLERLGYTALPAPSGTEGLQVARSTPQPIDLVLADVMLPEMRGEEFVRVMQKDQPGVKVLYMSGYSDGSMLSRDMEEDGAPFIGKPFTLFRLAQKVRQVLDGE